MKQKWKKIGVGCFMLALVILSGVSIWLAVTKNRVTETTEKKEVKKNKLGVEWYDENGKEFTITTADQLFEFAKLSVFYNFEGQTIKLGADIVVNEGNAADWGTQIPERMWDGVAKFAGTFDGQGHTISGICCYGQLYSGVNRTQVDYYTAGLFRFTQKDCVIKNFKLVNSYFKGDMQYGAAAISSNGDGTFESIYTDAIVVNCRSYTGGILGRTSTDKEKTVIRNCWFDGEVRMEGGFGVYIGGIVGRVMEGSTCTIEHCLNTGTISSDAYKKGIQMGGIVGNCQSSTKITDCLAAGELKNDWKSCVGSVVGGIVKAADVTMTDVYSIKESWEKSVGVSQGKLTGYPVTYPQDTLEDVGGYEWTTLDFEKYWVAVPDGIPVLKTFAKDALSCEGVAKKVDTSWYNEEEKTYVLKDEADFRGFSILSALTTFEGKTVKLAANLTLNSGRAADWAKQAPENEWMPIGSTTSEFMGTFDGQRHTISGVYLKTDQPYHGLFGVVGEKGKVKNFSLKNSYFETSKASFGSIAGRCRGTIDTVYSDAIVVSNDGVNVGGFIGQVPGVGNVSLNNCWFAGRVTNKGNDKTKRGVGGFIGSNLSDSKMTNCLFTGTVDATAYNTRNSETNKNVSPRAGGFVGIIGNKSKMNISYSLSTGTIKVNQAATVGFGPIVGNSGSMATLSHVYASDTCKKVDTGTVKGEVITYDQSKLNGYAGYQWTTLDFNKYWAVVVGPDKAPVLKSFTGKAPSVAGIVKFMDVSWYNAKKNVYVLNTLGELNGFALLSRETDFAGKTIKLGADIVANTGNAADWAAAAPANSWLGIGADANVRFKGTFDGAGHTISGLYMKTTKSYQGMFGNTAENAVVKNFRLVNSYFESNARGIGSIAGRGKGTFETIYSDAIVVGENASVGGLLGQDSPDGVHMNNCWFAGSVTNNQTDSSIGYGTGGLIGNLQNPSVVTNCLNTGTITADKYNRTPRVGGLIGAVPLATNTGVQISHCVNAGKVAGNGWELGGYGAFTGHIQSGHTGLFNYCYAVRDYDSEFARGYTGRIDTTTSKLVSEDEILGNDAEQKMPGLFTAGNTYWTTMENKMPVLTSFSEYANGAGNTDSLHRWLKNTTSPTVTLRTSQEVHNSAVRVFQQGGYTDGHYFWQAYITEKAYKTDAAGNIVEDIPNNKCKIVKTDLTGVEAPKYSQEFFGGHVNDITYNEKTEQLIVCTMNKDKELIFLDPDTLEETGSRNLTIYINSIDYNETKNQYVVGYVTETNTDETLGTIGASFRRFGIMNPDFTFKEEKFVPKSDTWGYVGQGAACDDEYIYMILSENKSVSLNPIIAVYDWEGNFVNRINLTIPVAADGIGGIQEADFSGVEAENISVVDNTIYIGVAVGNKTTNQRKVMAYSFAR